MIKKRGGARPGAGKPKGYKHKNTIMQAEAKQKLIDMVLQKWQPLIETKIDLALGEVYVTKSKDTLVTDPQGRKVRIAYKKEPDGNAINDLVAYVAGKPTQTLEAKVDAPSLDKLGESIKQILTNQITAQAKDDEKNS